MWNLYQQKGMKLKGDYFKRGQGPVGGGRVTKQGHGKVKYDQTALYSCMKMS
jgi:hypothetical protein